MNLPPATSGTIVWAVEFQDGSYCHPIEILSLWSTEAKADAELKRLAKLRSGYTKRNISICSWVIDPDYDELPPR